MDLWLVLLHELEEYVEDMSRLFPNLVGLLRRDFDNLKVALDIIVAYAVVGGAAFMRTHGKRSYFKQNQRPATDQTSCWAVFLQDKAFWISSWPSLGTFVIAVRLLPRKQ